MSKKQDLVPSDKRMIDLLKQVGLGIRKYGYSKVMKKLQSIDYDDQDAGEISAFVLTSCAKAYGIPISEMKGKKRGIFNDARVMAMALLCKHTKMSHASIGRMLDKSKSISVAASGRIKEAQISHLKQDVEFISLYNKIDLAVIVFKNKGNVVPESEEGNE